MGQISKQHIFCFQILFHDSTALTVIKYFPQDQNLNSKHCINLLQKMAMWIISFISIIVHILPIFTKSNVIKFMYNHFLSKSLSVFSSVFILTSNTHEQNTRSASDGLLAKPCWSTPKYGTNAFAASTIKSLNFFQKSYPLITIYVNYPTLNSNC